LFSAKEGKVGLSAGNFMASMCWDAEGIFIDYLEDRKQ